MANPSVPDYLKSLEAVLAPSSASAEAKAEAKASTDAKPQLESTLQSIGFGSMFPVTEPTNKDKLHVLLVSTHIHQTTGYSKVSHGIIQELAKESWLKVTHFAFQKTNERAPTNTRTYPSSVEVIDAAALEQPLKQGFNFQLLPEVIRKRKPDVVLLYNDLSIVTQFTELLRATGIPRTFKLWVYCDQVYPLQTQAYLDVLNRDADRVFAFTPEWKRCLKDQGVTRPVDVLLHGFDSNHFFTVPKELARKQVALPNDMFLILNMNRNQPRKRYDITIMAFVELLVKYPTKPIFMLCVCDKGDKGGWWLFELFVRELKLRGVQVDQFAQRLIITKQDMVFTDSEINMYYNAADVGISTADGEGWGLCQFEQMGVGVPQVVPAVGGYKEYCTAQNSVLVEPTVRYYLPTMFCPVGGEAHACNPHDICLGLEEYLLNSEKRKAHGEAAKQTVEGYTWTRACAPLIRRLREVKEGEE
jgi:hypothetical protein